MLPREIEVRSTGLFCGGLRRSVSLWCCRWRGCCFGFTRFARFTIEPARRPTLSSITSFRLRNLQGNERHESHLPRATNCTRNHSLLLRCVAGLPCPKNLSLLIDKPLQQADVFVVDFLDLIQGQEADLAAPLRSWATFFAKRGCSPVVVRRCARTRLEFSRWTLGFRRGGRLFRLRWSGLFFAHSLESAR